MRLTHFSGEECGRVVAFSHVTSSSQALWFVLAPEQANGRGGGVASGSQFEQLCYRAAPAAVDSLREWWNLPVQETQP